ncbi:MAG TPA: porphobilinogen synthase, partial [Verrucomicrobiota bacterium]|nr:porphobilinogen synthase [Verrucomicrobiota bacterium]
MPSALIGEFPSYRPRRLRGSAALRRMMRETRLHADQLVLPLFVRPGRKVRNAVASMPGVFQLSIDEAVREAAAAHKTGVSAVILFGIPPKKDVRASGAYDKNGIVQKAVRQLKRDLPELLVMTDVCLCEYMSHGHCGVVKKRDGRAIIDNDPSLKLLARTAVSHAEAGADVVAP